MYQAALDKVAAKGLIRAKYDNFIGGKWVAPVEGRYFDNPSPITGKTLCAIPRSTAADIELALDAAHAAKEAWAGLPSRTAPTSSSRSPTAWSRISISWRSSRRSTTASRSARRPPPTCRCASITGAISPARCARRKVRSREIDHDTVAYHYHEPLGVVGQIIPWNFPLLMAVWKLAPAIAAGNCVVLKPAEQTPLSILAFFELVGDLLPPGVVNVVNGFGLEAGKPLASSPRISKIAFTGETTTGRLIMQYASENLIPVTLELGGKSPNIFFEDVMEHDDDFFDKALEGFAMFALNQGEVCTCPSRVLVQELIYDKFMERAVERVKKVKQGHPLDPSTMIGAQASSDQLEKILSYLDIGRAEGAQVLTGGKRANLEGELAGGYYVEPTIFAGHNKMRIFQEEIFGPVVSVTKFKTEEEALAIANDTLYGLGAGVWTRSGLRYYRMGRGIHAGRVWINCYHAYPAHAAFGGYKQSGIGRETHKMMLDHYQQTKNLLISYSTKALGFF